MVFRSKIDLWLMTLLFAPAIFTLFQALSALQNGSNSIPHFVIFVILSGALLSLLIALLLSTKYTVTKNTLTIQSGLFKWRIDRNQITGISPSKSILSSPALSLDRLRIDYYQDGRRSVLISPKKKDEFLKAVAFKSNARSIAQVPGVA